MKSTVELKCQAYDILATIEQHQRAIAQLQQQLAAVNKQIVKAVQAEADMKADTVLADIAKAKPASKSKT